VGDQLASEVAQQRISVRFFSTQVFDLVSVTHDF